MTQIDLVERHSTALLEQFDAIIPKDRPVALVDFPDSANCGDHAIWLGEERLLERLGIEPSYRCSVQSYDRAEMAARLGAGTVLMHGGGNFGDRYRLYHEFRLRLLAEFPANKVIMFPQSITFLDNAYLRLTVAAFAKHSDVTLFGRSVDAHHLLKHYFAPAAKVGLAPDMAFMLGRVRRPAAPLYDVLWLARTDGEKASGNDPETVAGLAATPAERLRLPAFADGVGLTLVAKRRTADVLMTDWYKLRTPGDAAKAIKDADFRLKSTIFLARALYILSLGRVVVTDRLHAHILCILLRIPHFLLNSDAGKNWNFYETWTRDSPLCRLVPNAAEAWRLAQAHVAEMKQRES